jgi:hypothetical protein
MRHRRQLLLKKAKTELHRKSRKLILSHLDRCNAPSRRYEGQWLFLCETMWSLTSPSAKRINGPKKFRSSPKKDFSTLSAQSGQSYASSIS